MYVHAYLCVRVCVCAPSTVALWLHCSQHFLFIFLWFVFTNTRIFQHVFYLSPHQCLQSSFQIVTIAGHYRGEKSTPEGQEVSRSLLRSVLQLHQQQWWLIRSYDRLLDSPVRSVSERSSARTAVISHGGVCALKIREEEVLLGSTQRYAHHNCP